MKTIRIKVPASTANVGPGYDIFSIALAAPYDEIELRLNGSSAININIEGVSKNLIPSVIEENSGGLALLELFKRKKIFQGIDITINKKIPSGGGLGTTGATAAGCIYGINKLLDLNLSLNEMIDIARYGEIASGGTAHADNVAAALVGGFVLIKSYNPLEVLKIDLPEWYVVLAVIRKSERSTRGYITYDIGQERLKEQMANCSRVIHSICTENPEEFGKAINTDYIAEPVRAAAIPEYYKVKEKALQLGAYGFTISGGGSSVIAFCNEENQDLIAQMMAKYFAANPNFIEIIQTKTTNIGSCEMENNYKNKKIKLS